MRMCNVIWITFVILMIIWLWTHDVSKGKKRYNQGHASAESELLLGNHMKRKSGKQIEEERRRTDHLGGMKKLDKALVEMQLNCNKQ